MNSGGGWVEKRSNIHGTLTGVSVLCFSLYLVWGKHSITIQWHGMLWDQIAWICDLLGILGFPLSLNFPICKTGTIIVFISRVVSRIK